MIFDLTNSYFEGRKLDSILSKFGRSKEKRNDCKIINFSAVVNSEGFLRQSKIYQGNIANTKTLLPMIYEMKKSLNTSKVHKKRCLIHKLNKKLKMFYRRKYVLHY